MATSGIPSSPDFGGFTSDEDVKDYTDPYNGMLYDISASKKSDSYTAIFYTPETFSEISQLLQDLYVFQENKNKSGKETNFTFADKKVVLILYKTKKLLIQGSGSKLWRNSIFRKQSDKLTRPTVKKEQVNRPAETPVRRPVNETFQTPPQKTLTRSPLNFLNKVRDQVNKLRSPGIAANVFQFNKTDESTKPKVELEIDNDATFVKTTYQAKQQQESTQGADDDDIIISNVPETPENQKTEKTRESLDCKKKLEKQLSDNKQLQNTLKDLLSQSKILRSENERLLQQLNDCKMENKSLKVEVKTAVEKVSEKDNELKCVKTRLAKASSQTLILEEENTKLKKRVDTTSKEKTNLVDQLMKSTTANESIEAKIETEIHELKEVFLKEIQEIKNQVEKSMHSHIPTDCPKSNSSSQNPVKLTRTDNNTRGTENKNKANEESDGNSDRILSTGFIAGDSITRILSTKRISDTNLDIKIKTHSGGRVRSVENSILSMAEDESHFIRKTKAVVLHVGTNNVADADLPENIVEEFRDLIDTVQNINSNAHIVISSILPRKNDKLLNRIISETNTALNDFCREKKHHFLDNTDKFMKNGSPDTTLYSDHIHLNPKGGKLLGENIRHMVNSILGLPEIAPNKERPTSGERNFQNGRFQGRRGYQNNQRMYMPMPFYPPPWYNNRNQRNFSNGTQMTNNPR